jgi:hypothetical protein
MEFTESKDTQLSGAFRKSVRERFLNGSRWPVCALVPLAHHGRVEPVSNKSRHGVARGLAGRYLAFIPDTKNKKPDF